MDTIEDSKPLIRRRHSAALKAQVLAECAKPEAFVVRIAMAHGLNANLVHKWRRQASAPAASPSFIALQLAPVASALSRAVSQPAEDVRMELHRGALAVKVSWPISAAPACAAWLRELLCKRQLITLLTEVSRSDIEDWSQHVERHSPRMPVAGIDGRGTLVDADDDAYLKLKVLVIE